MSLAGQTSALDVVGVDGFVHLDYAATAPCVRAAADAVTSLLPYYGSVHRGTGLRSQTSTLEYERARDVVGAFLGVPTVHGARHRHPVHHALVDLHLRGPPAHRIAA